MHAADVLRFLGGTYAGEHRDIDSAVEQLTQHGIDPWLVTQYVRATTTGCPNHFVAETSRENALLHWREGNHSSVKHKLVEVMNVMAKEHRNRYNMPLPCYIARFVPHLFLTPQHALEKPGKAMRLIFDAAKRFTPESVPINMMTSTSKGTEMDCLYGDTLLTLLERIYDLRITYPTKDIALHANDVKSCFKQMKLHPDIMPAFSVIVAQFLFLQPALPFGTDFSPQNWEPVRRIIEILARKLFSDDTLRHKHRKYLDQLRWDRTLNGKDATYTVAKACQQRRGVLNNKGEPVPTPQRMFVDDGVLADIYNDDKVRIEKAIAAGIEAIFILLGRSDLSKRQDPVSFDKMVEMMVSHLNKVLGQIIDTRRMNVGVPQSYIAQILMLLKPFHYQRKSFTVKEMERVTGMLVFVAATAPWLKFIMSQVYVSLAAAIGNNTAHLNRTNKQFRKQLMEARSQQAPNHKRTFSQACWTRQVHSCPKGHWINTTLREELHLIAKALTSGSVTLKTPIAHLVRRDPSAEAWSDSSLRAAGGYSTDLKFWWHIEWPAQVAKYTLVYVQSNKDGTLVSINVLEYAALLVNYAAACCYYLQHTPRDDPFPVVRFYVDNTSSEAWGMKGCTGSLIGRALSRLQCAMMIGNNVAARTARVDTKANVIADRISRVNRATNIAHEFPRIAQDYPELSGCKRFHPSAELISHIMDAISQKKSIDPLEVSNSLRHNPGSIIS